MVNSNDFPCERNSNEIINNSINSNSLDQWDYPFGYRDSKLDGYKTGQLESTRCRDKFKDEED